MLLNEYFSPPQSLIFHRLFIKLKSLKKFNLQHDNIFLKVVKSVKIDNLISYPMEKSLIQHLSMD